MNLHFEKVTLPKDQDRLIQFLTSESWPFHVNSRLEKQNVESMLENGYFGGTNTESHWISDLTNTDLGLIRLFDLDDVDDGYPMFDLRIRAAYRGRGVGRAAIEWLVDHLFQQYPALDRIAGTTRADNEAMRRLFRSCLFAKEGHYRNDWPGIDGSMFDTVKYSLLRDDWVNKKITPVRWNDEI